MLDYSSDMNSATLPGVRSEPLAASPERLQAVQDIAHRLVSHGVRYGDHSRSVVPWLCAEHPFRIDAALRLRIERLGQAVYALLDAIQHLYSQKDEVVRAYLDHNVPEALRGLQTDQEVVTFRLDLMIENGLPRVTEIEEIYGNVGKMAAFQSAYGVDNTELFHHFAQLSLSGIYVDDSLPTYLSEVKLLQAKLKSAYDQEVPVRFFSEFPAQQEGVVWRFCRTRDFEQYDPSLRSRILAADCLFINPLFHGYGVKTVLALPFHDQVGQRIQSRIGDELFATLLAGIPKSRYLDDHADHEIWAGIAADHRNHVLKVVDCPEKIEYTWGSRGVFFGDRSATRWRRMVDAAAKGSLAADPDCRRVRYMVMELVESDRFDVSFHHPSMQALAVMRQARIRLTPIFWRSAGKVRLLAGHASFVNTSRKVHLGSHAVCAPLVWDRALTPTGSSSQNPNTNP